MLKREFLSGKGFNVGRGRPSREAMAAMAAYRAEHGAFDDDTSRPVVVKSATATTEKHALSEKKEKHAFDPRVVRNWARANNVAVGERGRIAPEVLIQFEKANPDAEKVSPDHVFMGKDLRPSAPRIHPEGSRWRSVEFPTYVVGDRTACMNCRVSLAYCGCSAPMVVLSNSTPGRVTIV